MVSHRPLAVVCLLFCSFLAARAAEPFRYPIGRAGNAEMKYINNLPVLTVGGSPEEIGAAVGRFALKPSSRLLSFPRGLLKAESAEDSWPFFLRCGKGMVAHFPADYRTEMAALAHSADADPDAVTVANTFFDLKSTFQCSALAVEGPRSATGGVLFGRNLDYPSLGYIHEHTLVTVYRPTGKHAFASIGFPGIVGVLSGMNDAGLCAAVLEVYDAKEGEPHFNPKGIPYALCNRRLLEECTTIAEAKKLLESMPRTSLLNLAVADRTTTAVFEVTPKQVALRPSVRSVCTCTNHFCTDEVKLEKAADLFNSDERLDILDKARGAKGKLGVEDLHKYLHAVNQGELTLQTMIFDPVNLRLHMAFGKRPSSGGDLRAIDLAPQFTAASHTAD
jgi:isopenicillin-N N-acyltransferase like protein